MFELCIVTISGSKKVSIKWDRGYTYNREALNEWIRNFRSFFVGNRWCTGEVRVPLTVAEGVSTRVAFEPEVSDEASRRKVRRSKSSVHLLSVGYANVRLKVYRRDWNQWTKIKETKRMRGYLRCATPGLGAAIVFTKISPAAKPNFCLPSTKFQWDKTPYLPVLFSRSFSSSRSSRSSIHCYETRCSILGVYISVFILSTFILSLPLRNLKGYFRYYGGWFSIYFFFPSTLVIICTFVIGIIVLSITLYYKK